MADYTYRWDELQSMLRDPQHSDLEHAGRSAANQALALSCYTVAANHLQTYCDVREKLLAAMLLTLSDAGDVTGADRQGHWQDAMTHAGTDICAALTDALSRIHEIELRAPALRETLNTILQQEAQFYPQLARVPLAFFQGSVQQHQKDFKSAADMLTTKWKDLGDAGRTADEKATATMAQVKALFSDIVEKVVAQDRDITEKLRNVKVDPGAPITGSGVATLLLKGAIQIIMAELEIYRRSTSSYVNDLAQAFGAEEQIIVMFGEIRNVITQFMQTTNLNTAISEFNESKRNGLDMAGQCPTGGQREDGKRFVENGAKIVESCLMRFKDAYENFVSANRGIFVGAVESNRVDELLQLSAAENAWDVVERVNIQTTLKELQDHSVNWKVSVDGLDSNAANDLQNAFSIELKPLAEGIVAANNDRLVDQLRTMVKDKIAKLRDTALRLS